jgi:hypothetical protein
MWQWTQHLQQLQAENSQCSNCTELLSGTRNMALEKLALRVDCLYPNEILTFLVAHIIEHEDVCNFGPFDCPLNYRIKCNWLGYLIEIKDYFL